MQNAPYRALEGATVNAIGYVRVSTDDQAENGHSVDAQLATIAAEVDRRGWTLVEAISENGSGKTVKRRPELQRALKLLEDGDANVLVTTKLDRLTRSVADLSRLIERSRHGGWALVTLDVALDTTTPSGKAMAQLIGVFAEWEREMISERTKAGLAAARAKGKRIGRPRAVSDETVDQIRAWRGDGTTLQAIADRLTETEVPTGHGGRWQPATIARLLDR